MPDISQSHTRRVRGPLVSHATRVIAWASVLAAVSLGIGSSGCAKTHAKTVPDGPPLEVPAPPPRVLAPVDEPAPTPTPAPETPAPTPPRTIPHPVSREPNRTEPSQKPAEATPPETAPSSPPEPKPPEGTRTLRTPGPAVGDAEKTIRDMLSTAARDLSRVDYGKLSDDGRAQYEQSKRFMQQAEQALKDQNLVFAQTLAGKAATLAAELLGR
jgi:outer membrane biosynthesis protein TonB